MCDIHTTFACHSERNFSPSRVYSLCYLHDIYTILLIGSYQSCGWRATSLFEGFEVTSGGVCVHTGAGLELGDWQLSETVDPPEIGNQPPASNPP